MRHTQRTVILITLVTTVLATVATSTAAAAPAARGTTRMAKGCISVIATIPVGNAPFGIAANSKTRTIYVTNAADRTVSVINGRTNTVTATVPVGVDAVAAAANRGPTPSM